MSYDSSLTPVTKVALPEEKPVEKQSETVNAILKTGRLFLRNLSYSCVDSDLQELFSPFGAISQVSVLPSCCCLQ